MPPSRQPEQPAREDHCPRQERTQRLWAGGGRVLSLTIGNKPWASVPVATGQLWAGALLETAFEWSSCSQSLASWTPTLQGWILLRRGGLLPAAHGPGAARQLSPRRPLHTDLREGRRHEMCGQCASRAPVRLRGQLPQ